MAKTARLTAPLMVPLQQVIRSRLEPMARAKRAHPLKHHLPRSTFTLTLCNVSRAQLMLMVMLLLMTTLIPRPLTLTLKVSLNSCAREARAHTRPHAPNLTDHCDEHSQVRTMPR